MNDEERQYWINILPIMTPEQIGNLQNILTSEKTQLAAIDAKYSKDGASIGSAAMIASMEANIKNKKVQREQTEREAAMQEEITEENLLQKIQGM